MYRIGLFLDSEPYSGGMFQYNQSIIDALNFLPKEEFKVSVIYTNKSWANYLLKYDFEAKHVRVNAYAEYLSKIGKYYFLKVWRKLSPQLHPLLSTIYNSRCDLWVFPSQDNYSYQVEINAISAIHDLMHRYENFPEINGDGEFKRREHLFSNIAKYSKVVLVDSNCGKNQVIDCYSQVEENKVQVLPYVAPPYILEEESDDFDLLYSLPSKFLFYPAQFWEHKNHLNLFYALAEAKKVYPDIKLVLVGSKKNGYEKAVSVINDLHLKDNIQHLGYVEDKYIPSLYKRARALVMPTFFGPTNIPPLEAMALGCPMAVSDIYGMKEQSNDAALYFNPHSIAEICESIKLLWIDDHLCKQLSENSYKQYKSWNQVHFNEKFASVIREAIQKVS